MSLRLDFWGITSISTILACFLRTDPNSRLLGLRTPDSQISTLLVATPWRTGGRAGTPETLGPVSASVGRWTALQKGLEGWGVSLQKMTTVSKLQCARLKV